MDDKERRSPTSDGTKDREKDELQNLIEDDPSIETELDKLGADSFPASDPPSFNGSGRRPGHDGVSEKVAVDPEEDESR